MQFPHENSAIHNNRLSCFLHDFRILQQTSEVTITEDNALEMSLIKPSTHRLYIVFVDQF
jgi:hypothetical protein